MYRWTLRHREPTDSNLVNPQLFTQGFFIGLLGVITPDEDFMHSHYIDVEPGTVYNLHSTTGVIATVTYYDLLKQYISTDFELLGLSTFTPPANAYLAKITTTSVSAGQPADEIGITAGAASSFTSYFRSRVVKPIYKKLGRGFKMESNQQYYREKLEGSFKFIAADFEYIHALDFDTRMLIKIEDLQGVINDYNCYFFKTDCKWDEDDKSVEVKTKPDDNYEKIIGGLQKTFNLIDVAPELQEVTIRRRPIIQVYVMGDNVLTNILGGTSWEQELQVDPVFDHADLTSSTGYSFFNSKNIVTIPASYAAGLSTDVTGEYSGSPTTNANGLYYIDSQIVVGAYVARRYFIRKVSDDAILYETSFGNYFTMNISQQEFNPVGSETGSFYVTEYRIYVRYYTDKLNVRGTDTNAVNPNDIVANNSNYKRVIGYDIDDFYIHDEFTTVPTKYGKVPEGAPDVGKYYKEYLVAPSTGLSNPLPISSSNWRAVSLWFFNNLNIRYTEFIDGEDFVLRDAYPIHSVISKLLEKVGSTVSFLNTTEYSEFLYAASNPLSGFTFLDFNGGTLVNNFVSNVSHFITPKSNIISSNYNQAAKKADITLNQMLSMLRDTYKLYWHVEGNKLRIEHITWYQKGGTYGANIVGADITQLRQPRNSKNWGFNQNKWEFDKEAMPERFEYSWMDDVTKPFEGFNIDVLSNYTQEGRIEDLAVQGVTTDIDYIMATPQEVSKSGFCMLSCVVSDGLFKVPFIEIDMGYNQQVILQNGFLSWLYLHPKYHTFDLPSDRVNINDEDVTLLNNNTRQKKQEVTFPASAGINPYQLVKTALGDGVVDKLVLSMESYIVKATIKHDTQ